MGGELGNSGVIRRDPSRAIPSSGKGLYGRRPFGWTASKRDNFVPRLSQQMRKRVEDRPSRHRSKIVRSKLGRKVA